MYNCFLLLNQNIFLLSGSEVGQNHCIAGHMSVSSLDHEVLNQVQVINNVLNIYFSRCQISFIAFKIKMIRFVVVCYSSEIILIFFCV